MAAELVKHYLSSLPVAVTTDTARASCPVPRLQKPEGQIDEVCVVMSCTVDHAIIINDTRTTLRAATPSTPAQLTMSRSLAKVISATRLSSRSRA
jgi:hypothetical protein